MTNGAATVTRQAGMIACARQPLVKVGSDLHGWAVTLRRRERPIRSGVRLFGARRGGERRDEADDH